jgi:hypothetical protein
MCRYYSNNVTDVDKQCAFNLLLGAYVPDPEGKKPHIWELDVGMNHAESDQKFGHENDIFKVPYLSYILGARMGRFAYDLDAMSIAVIPSTTSASSPTTALVTSTSTSFSSLGHERRQRRGAAAALETLEEQRKRRVAQIRLKQFLNEYHDPSHMTSFKTEFEHEFNKPVYVATTLNPSFGPPSTTLTITSATITTTTTTTTTATATSHPIIPNVRPNHPAPPPPSSSTAGSVPPSAVPNARPIAVVAPPSHPPPSATAVVSTTTTTTTAVASATSVSATAQAPSSLSPPTTPVSSSPTVTPMPISALVNNNDYDEEFSLDRSRGRSAAMSVFSIASPSPKLPSAATRSVARPPTGARPPPSSSSGLASINESNTTATPAKSLQNGVTSSGTGSALSQAVASQQPPKHTAYQSLPGRGPPHPMTLASVSTSTPSGGSGAAAGSLNAPLRSGSPVRPRPPLGPPPDLPTPTAATTGTGGGGSSNSSNSQRPAAPSTLPPHLVELLFNAIAQQPSMASSSSASGYNDAAVNNEFSRYVDTNRLFTGGVIAGAQYGNQSQPPISSYLIISDALLVIIIV